jgi:hypothetical protein
MGFLEREREKAGHDGKWRDYKGLRERGWARTARNKYEIFNPAVILFAKRWDEKWTITENV